jgi:UDP-2,3-diacylglucosamine hydrolase
LNDSIFFLSDTHFSYHRLSDVERKKRETFLSFLGEIKGSEKLYLLGDIFDFWFYGRRVPESYQSILEGLRTLVLSGTEVLITGGNHDHWLGDYLSETIGLTILPTVTTHELQGMTVTMTHGDALLPGDLAYKTLKAVIRSGPAIALARLVPPALLFGFASRFSRASKGVTHRQTERWAETLADRAERSFFHWDNDVFVMGHVHLPLLRRFGEKTFVILGDWEEHFSYLELRDGELFLRRYNPED